MMVTKGTFYNDAKYSDDSEGGLIESSSEGNIISKKVLFLNSDKQNGGTLEVNYKMYGNDKVPHLGSSNYSTNVFDQISTKKTSYKSKEDPAIESITNKISNLQTFSPAAQPTDSEGSYGTHLPFQSFDPGLSSSGQNFQIFQNATTPKSNHEFLRVQAKEMDSGSKQEFPQINLNFLTSESKEEDLKNYPNQMSFKHDNHMFSGSSEEREKLNNLKNYRNNEEIIYKYGHETDLSNRTTSAILFRKSPPKYEEAIAYLREQKNECLHHKNLEPNERCLNQIFPKERKYKSQLDLSECNNYPSLYLGDKHASDSTLGFSSILTEKRRFDDSYDSGPSGKIHYGQEQLKECFFGQVEETLHNEKAFYGHKSKLLRKKSLKNTMGKSYSLDGGHDLYASENCFTIFSPATENSCTSFEQTTLNQDDQQGKRQDSDQNNIIDCHNNQISDKPTLTRKKSLKNSIGKSYSLDDGKSMYAGEDVKIYFDHTLDSSCNTQDSSQESKSYSNEKIHSNKMYLPPEIQKYDSVDHGKFSLSIPGISERRPSAQSLPDLSGPFLDSLCPFPDQISPMNDKKYVFPNCKVEELKYAIDVVIKTPKCASTDVANSSVNNTINYNVCEKQKYSVCTSIEEKYPPQPATIKNGSSSNFLQGQQTSMTINIEKVNRERLTQERERYSEERERFTQGTESSTLNSPLKKNLTIKRLNANNHEVKMHLSEYSTQSLSPEPLLSSDFNSCDFVHSSAFSPPTINVEAPPESDICSSFLSATTAISGALGELHSEMYLTGEEWSNSLENFLTSIHDGEVFLDGITPSEEYHQCNVPSHPPAQMATHSNRPPCLLELPSSNADELDRYLGPHSRLSVSPMSISPGNTSPFGSQKGSFFGPSWRKHKRSNSNSSFNYDAMDIGTIIRSSPSCLSVNNPPTSVDNISVSTGGTYGHLTPRNENNTCDSDETNLSFQSLLADDIMLKIEPSFHQTNSFIQNFLPDAFATTALQTNFKESSDSPKPSHESSALNTYQTSNSEEKNCSQKNMTIETPPNLQHQNPNETYLEEERAESPEEEDGPRVCKWVDCNVTFPNRESLSRHIERAHIDQRKGDDFTCFWAACQRRYRPFNARYKLLIHMRVHSGEKPNKCTFKGCPKAFSRLENLKIHLRSHTGERPYICVYSNCNKAFSNSSDRAKHQRTHVDAKPYICSVPGCKKRYTDPSSLRKHVKNHTSKEQALAKRKSESSSYPGHTVPIGGRSSSLSVETDDLIYMEQNENGRMSQRAINWRCSSLQSPVSRPLAEAFSGAEGGHLNSTGHTGGPGCLGEHLLSFPSPPHTPNYEGNDSSSNHQLIFTHREPSSDYLQQQNFQEQRQDFSKLYQQEFTLNYEKQQQHTIDHYHGPIYSPPPDGVNSNDRLPSFDSVLALSRDQSNSFSSCSSHPVTYPSGNYYMNSNSPYHSHNQSANNISMSPSSTNSP